MKVIKILLVVVVLAVVISGIPSSVVVYVVHADVEEVQNEYEVIRAEISAYTSSRDETDDTPFITANGEKVFDGGVACPGRFKFGTKIEIQGKKYTCNDRMNARYSDKNYFDIWMTEKKLAFDFGRQSLEVKVFE